MLQAFNGVVGGGRIHGAVELPRGRLIERLHSEGRFPASGDAGDAGQRSHGDLGVHILQIIPPGAAHAQELALAGFAAADRHFDFTPPGQVLAGQALRVSHHDRGRALGDNLSAMDAGGGSHVDDMIGAENGFFVVFHHQNAVAEVPQALQGVQKPGVIALVQPD